MPERVKNNMLVELNTISEAIGDIKAGKVVIVVDNEERENEGDFICAAELITPEIVNFMATYGRGLICAPIPEKRCEQLELELMVSSNTSMHSTPFTVSVDLLGNGCTTGISASDRAKTIRALVDPETRPEDMGRPGHIFPLKAKTRGVLRRPGHTEAVVDLARLAGLKPGGALVEIMNDDGSMARLPELIAISKKHKLKIITIKSLIAYLLEQESLIIKGEKAKLPTKFGTFTVIPFIQKSNRFEHLALIKGTWTHDDPVLVRVHSSCMTGDIFSSYRCDCGSQLHEAMRMIEKAGQGVIVYLNQEGRGIGLFNKIKAYNLQEKGRDTVEANLDLGFEEDERDYGVGASILHELGLGKVRLITNNPVKRAGLEGYGISVVDNIPLDIPPNEHNIFYLKTKKNKMGHLLELLEDKDFRIENEG
jgi:3,4-dihydroxy 2-butanone 4-phosphate synthase/GTP cyclohydrolase II